MSSTSDLIERSSELKRQLLEFSEKPRYKRAFEPFLEQYFPGKLVLDEAQFANLLDWFLMEHRLKDGLTLVEHFVAEHPELPERERVMLLGWKGAVMGVFEVKGRDGEALVAVNLVDEMTYRLRSNAGSTVFDAMRPGSFLMTRAVPLGDEWLLSGISSMLPASEKEEAYRSALDFATHDPSLVFRNPEKLKLAWNLQRQLHEAFVEFFGSDTVVVPRRELAERMTAFDRFYVFEHRGTDGKTAAEHAKETYGSVPEPPTFSIPGDMAPGETVGVLSDAKEGIQYLADFGLVEETFADPTLAADPTHRDLVLTYLDDDSVSPLALRRLSERDPERASQVFRQILKKPRFSWSRDGESLLRQRKKRLYERPVLPSVTPLSDELTRAQMAASRKSDRPRHRSRPAGRPKRRIKHRSSPAR